MDVPAPEESESIFALLSLLQTYLSDCRTPTHIGEGDLLHSVYRVKSNLFQNYSHRHPPKTVFYQ